MSEIRIEKTLPMQVDGEDQVLARAGAALDRLRAAGQSLVEVNGGLEVLAGKLGDLASRLGEV